MSVQQDSPPVVRAQGHEVPFPRRKAVPHKGVRHAYNISMNQHTNNADLYPAPLQLRRPTAAPVSLTTPYQHPIDSQRSINETVPRNRHALRQLRCDSLVDMNQIVSNQLPKARSTVPSGNSVSTPPLELTAANLRQLELQIAAISSVHTDARSHLIPRRGQSPTSNRYSNLPHNMERFDTTRFFQPSEVIPVEQLSYRLCNTDDLEAYINGELNGNVEPRLEKYKPVQYFSVAGHVKQGARQGFVILTNSEA